MYTRAFPTPLELHPPHAAHLHGHGLIHRHHGGAEGRLHSGHHARPVSAHCLTSVWVVGQQEAGAREHGFGGQQVGRVKHDGRVAGSLGGLEPTVTAWNESATCVRRGRGTSYRKGKKLLLGGRVIWLMPPPAHVCTAAGSPGLAAWRVRRADR
jgi:hypothetical protein